MGRSKGQFLQFLPREKVEENFDLCIEESVFILYIFEVVFAWDSILT